MIQFESVYIQHVANVLLCHFKLSIKLGKNKTVTCALRRAFSVKMLILRIDVRRPIMFIHALDGVSL